MDFEPPTLVRIRLVKSSGLKSYAFTYPTDEVQVTERAFYEGRGEAKGAPDTLYTFRRVGITNEFLEVPGSVKYIATV